MKGWLPDQYVLRARIMPSFVILLPIIALALAYVPGFQTLVDGIAKSTIGLLIYLLSTSLLSGFSRRAGKALESRLFSSWGGIPTTQILRHRDTRLDATTKQRLHSVLGAATGLAFPTRKDESNDPDKADEVYSSATNWLRENVPLNERSHRIKEENINYGFSRNLYGMKNIGIIISITCSIIPIYKLRKIDYNSYELLNIDVLLLAFFLVYIFAIARFASENWVKETAFDYARALITTADQIKRPEIANRK